MGYRATWDSTDQVPERAISAGLLSRFGHIDPTDGGHTYRYSLAADVRRSGLTSSTRASAYVLRYGLNLLSNFTYFLDDPVDGDQLEQADRRVVTGGLVTYRRLGHLGQRNVESALGVQLRHDAIGASGLYRTTARRRLSTTRDDKVGQTSVGAFAQSEIAWNRSLRTVTGLRSDVYRFNVQAGNPANSGEETSGLLSPKISAVLGPWASTEIYLNAGMGFHSNDARGATITEDPVTGEPVDRVTPLVRARGAEIGLRTARISGVQTTVSLWMLGFDSELLFIGDAGTTAAGRPSRRVGVEWTNYARVAPWLTLDADISFSRARFTEDDSVHSKSTTLVNAEVGYRHFERTRVMLEVFNMLDAKVSDIDYFYTSRLPGEAPEGLDDVHTHPALPRTARLMLQVSF